jgi:hypothetical protein
MDRLEHLRAAMTVSFQGGVDRALVRWVSQHHGEPQSLDSARLKAIVLDFDTFLMQPGVEDTEFTRAMIRLRNVFARHAKMSAPTTVILADERKPEPPRPQPLVIDEDIPTTYRFDANSVLAEALSRLLSSPGGVDGLGLPPFGEALPGLSRSSGASCG